MHAVIGLKKNQPVIAGKLIRSGVPLTGRDVLDQHGAGFRAVGLPQLAARSFGRGGEVRGIAYRHELQRSGIQRCAGTDVRNDIQWLIRACALCPDKGQQERENATRHLSNAEILQGYHAATSHAPHRFQVRKGCAPWLCSPISAARLNHRVIIGEKCRPVNLGNPTSAIEQTV